MQIKINSRKHRTGESLATGAVISAFLLVNLAVLTVLFPDLPIATEPVVAAGFVMGVAALLGSRRWLVEPKPHRVLPEGLKGLGKEAALYHYYFPADHVLIAPEGVFSLTTRVQAAAGVIRDNRFVSTEPLLKRIARTAALLGVGDPVRDAARDAAKTQAWFDHHLPGAGIQVQPVILFIHPDANIYIESCTTPVVYPGKRKPSLKAFIREQKQPSLTAEQIAEVDALLQVKAN
ncbi:MAG: hypothetical protein Kow00124_02820 [Anaerolineae bacterium]